MNRTVGLVGMIATVSASAAWAGASYTYDSGVAAERTLFVEVPENEEAAFDKSQFFLEGATVTNITKRGKGKLTFAATDDLSASSFSIRIEAGVYQIAHTRNVGVLGEGSIDVADGATFYNAGGMGTETLGTEYGANKLVRVEGEGHDGMGALIQYYATNGERPFGHTVLTDDTLIRLGGPNAYILFKGDFDLAGHKLTMETTKATYLYHFLIESAGNIDWIGVGDNAIAGLNDYQCIACGDASNRISLSNILLTASSCFPAVGCNFDWTLSFGPRTAFRVETGFYTGYGSGNKYNLWNGPIEIGCGTLPVSTAPDKGSLSFGFMGKVTGGGLALNGSETSRLDFYLGSGENDFTGGVVGQDVDLHLLHDGAVPADGGAVALTNATVCLDDAAADYHLPDVSIDGSGEINGGASVTFKSLKKSGSGTVTLGSAFKGAETLTVEDGTLDLSAAIRGSAAREKLAGLVFGNKPFSDYSSDEWSIIAWTVANNGWPLGTNEVVNAASMLYNATTSATGWENAHVYSYEGYIWNDASTDVDFNFIGCSISPWSFWVDGKMVMGCWMQGGAFVFREGYTDDMHWYGDYALKTLRLSPGPHRICYITAPGSWDSFGMPYGCAFLNYSGKYQNTFAGDLYEYAGDSVCLLAFNSNGKATRDVRDYQKLIDSGDGSVVTWADPSGRDQIVHPISGEPISLVRDSVKNLVCRGNAVVKLNSETWMLETLEGLPDVGEAGLWLSDSWTIDPSEFGTHTLSLDGKLTFADGAKLLFKPGKPVAEFRRGGKFLIAEAAGGVEGVPTLVDDERWGVSVEGTRVYAWYKPDGLSVILR